MDMPTGNGTFVTAAGSANTGTGTISAGTVTSPSALTGDQYTITIGAGGTTYNVQNTTTGTSAASGSYTSPTSISFDGMQVQLSGTPAAGDTFTVAPSGYQSIFTTLANAITALQTPTAGSPTAAAQQSAALTTALGNVQQAITSMSTSQASMGAQLAELNTYSTVNSDRTLQDQTQMSSIVDLDYAKGDSQLSQQETQFQAALQSYASISKLSLFNYIT